MTRCCGRPRAPARAGHRGRLQAEGVLEGAFPVRVAATLDQAFAGADVALLTVPAYALPALLPRIAAAIPKDLPLLIVARRLARAARLRAAARRPARRSARWPPRPSPAGASRPTACASPPSAPGPRWARCPAPPRREMAALAEALFGNRWPVVPDALAAAFINTNPIAHAALALANVTRIEQRETWGQYGLMTPAVCRLMEALAPSATRSPRASATIRPAWSRRCTAPTACRAARCTR